MNEGMVIRSVQYSDEECKLITEKYKSGEYSREELLSIVARAVIVGNIPMTVFYNSLATIIVNETDITPNEIRCHYQSNDNVQKWFSKISDQV